MGRRWDAYLPVVVVPRGAPKRVTFVYPYYENAAFLGKQLAWWSEYPQGLRQHLSAVIVDDGSPIPAEDMVRSVPAKFPIRLFRVEEDRRWNWIAARNIGMTHAEDGWCVLTDMDHVISAETADAVVHGQHQDGVIYGFSRVEATSEPLAAHPNSWLMTKVMFWKVGGYDEMLSGHYGTDGDWRRRCAKTAPMEILADRLVRHEHEGDSSTVRYKRKQPEDAAVKRLIAARGRVWRPKTLSFAYHEVQV